MGQTGHGEQDGGTEKGRGDTILHLALPQGIKKPPGSLCNWPLGHRPALHPGAEQNTSLSDLSSSSSSSSPLPPRPSGPAQSSRTPADSWACQPLPALPQGQVISLPQARGADLSLGRRLHQR